MKIVFVNPVGVIGGAERALLTILAALGTAQPNIQLYLIVCTDGPLVEKAQEVGVQVKILPLPEQVTQLGDSGLKGKNRLTAGLILLFRVATILPAIAQYLAQLRQTIQQINPDLIHSNGIKTHLLTGLLRLKSVPVIWHLHDFYSTRPLIARVLRWISNWATAGIAVSEAVAQDARATLPRLPIEVIYNSVDVNDFSPKFTNFNRLNSALDTLSLAVNPIRVGLVATFARWKGHDVFLEAAAFIIRDRVFATESKNIAASSGEHRPDLNVHFYIVGGAIYQTQGSQFSEQELRDKAAVLQIADKVDFLGFQQDIADVYRWLDIVVHASTQPEPFGLAIVEAMACGKPVIVSRSGGAAELFTDNYDAVGVQPGDSTALASAIQHLIDNPDLCKRLSENARNTVLTRFSHNHLGERILEAYKSFSDSIKVRSPLTPLKKGGT